MKINTDQQKINELLSSGIENIYPKKEFLEAQLKSGKRLTLYTGYDPTAPTLHIGHGITMLKLRQFQELGHKVIMLIGDFTGMIGDPTDKTSARQKLTRKQVLENCKNYQKQASVILDFKGLNKVEVKYNSKWLAKMNMESMLELSSNITVDQLLQRDMFEKRRVEGKPIFLHEFLYPLMQGYDSVAMNVDGEVGGNDQTFNMLVGRDLQKIYHKKEKFVLTTKLLVDASGKKMGKTEGNMVAFSDTPEDTFGKVMSWTDDMIRNGFELCTTVPMGEIKRLEMEIKNPRDLKLRLAYEIVKIFLGESFARKAQEHFITVFQNKEKPKDIIEMKVDTGTTVAMVLADTGLVSSKSEAYRLAEQGGIKKNDEEVKNIDELVKPGDIIQKGKRGFVKIK